MKRIYLRLVTVTAIAVGLGVSGPAAKAVTNLSPGTEGAPVRVLQRELEAIGLYRGGDEIGVYGSATEQAVMAFHKTMGLERSFDWQVDDWDYLEAWDLPELPDRPDEGTSLEIDLTRQVAFVVTEGEVVAVVPVSSANGKTYRSQSGNLARAHTPEGDFKIYRHIAGWRHSYLGRLWRPWYFRGGYAIHGSSSVPAGPASHGCIRVPMWEADWLESLLTVGDGVHIWRSDQVHAPVPPGMSLPAFLSVDPAGIRVL